MSDRTIRCVITGNIAGTDTRPEGQPCTCENCRIAADSALLDRVRAKCLIEYPSRANPAYEDGPALSTMLTIDGPTDLLRELAEVLKQS